MANVLILHATVGTGHKSAAMALEKSLKRAGAERVWVQDTLEYGAEWFRRLYADSWIDLVEKASPIWGMAYHESARTDDKRLTRDLRKLYSKLGVNRIKELEALEVDAVVCTHFLPIDVGLKHISNKGLRAPVYCVVTDYVGHPYWANPKVAGTFVGNELARDMLIHHGLVPEKVHITGIPVDPDILVAKDREALRRQHGLGDQHVVTLIGSGLSETHVRIMIEGLLARNVAGTLYVVAGRNHDLLEEIDDIEGNDRLSFKPLGFIDYLDDLMVMSDLIITKSGGLITSELLARATPMVIVDPIPGQEEYNADYVTQMGAGVHARLPESVPYLVEHLLQYPEQLARCRTQAREFGRPRAALEIAAKVLADAGNRRPDFGVAMPGLNL